MATKLRTSVLSAAVLGLLALALGCQKMPAAPPKVVPPSVRTDSAGAVAARSATLRGSVNPNGWLTFWYFVYAQGSAAPETTAVAQAGSGKTEVPVSRAITGLQPGTAYRYKLIAGNGTMQVAGAEDTLRTRQIPHISLDSSSLTFSNMQGGTLPAAKVVRATNTGGDTLHLSAADDAIWLDVTMVSPTSDHTTISVKIASNELAPGTYGATITVTDPNADNSPQIIAVTYTVIAPPPHFVLDSTTLNFGATQNGPPPATKSFTLTNTGGGTLDWSFSATTTWLSVDPPSGRSNRATITASITSTALPPGSYFASISATSSNADNAPPSVQVTYTVVAAPHIAVSSTALGFATSQNGPLPSAKTFTITNTGGGTLNWTVSADQSWLDLSPKAGTSNQAVVTVSITTTTLPPGTYFANIEVSDPDADNARQSIAVTYTMTPPLPHITLDSTSLSFSAYSRGALPAAKSFTITNTGSDTLLYTVTFNVDWLWVSDSITPNGDTAIVITRIANTDVPVGTYTGTITVSSTRADNSPQTVSVSYTVLNPWTMLAGGETGPGPRVDHTAIYDPSNQSMVVFGGFDGRARGDVWRFDLRNNTWTKLADEGAGPTARVWYSAILDESNRSMVIFGGTDASGRRGDVWKFDLQTATWTNPATDGQGPTSREEHTAIYDPINKSMVVFGGWDGTNRGDVWKFDLQNSVWTMIAGEATGPPPRYYHTAVYDPSSHTMIIYGGEQNGAYRGDVWQFDLTSPGWTKLADAGSGPSARLGHTAVLDSDRRSMLIFGGHDGSYRGDVWAFDLPGHAWLLLGDDGQGPSNRMRHASVFDTRTGVMIIHGGHDQTNSFADVWGFRLWPPSAGLQAGHSAWVEGPNEWRQQLVSGTPRTLEGRLIRSDAGRR